MTTRAQLAGASWSETPWAGRLRSLAKAGIAVVLSDYDGGTVVLIAHKLAEVLAVADRLTVLRKGKTVGTLDGSSDEDEIVKLMMGGRPIPTGTGSIARHNAGDDRSLIEISGMSTAGQQFAVPLHDIHLSVLSGEIVGLAGVAGNGQRELVEALMGLRAVRSGRIVIGGRDATKASVAPRIRAGVGLIPSDRLNEGIIRVAPLYESYALGLHCLWRDDRWTVAMLRNRAREVIPELNIAAPTETAATGTLSGGNVQKLCVGRALTVASTATGGSVVAVNPTSGLDVSATSFVRAQLIRIAQEGKGVLLVSEDLDELFELCGRILVIHAGKIVAEYDRSGFDRYEIGARMVGEQAPGKLDGD